jgi:hypothetical protein
MLQTQQIEELITVVSTLDRAALLQHFRQFPASFPIDFTSEFLDHQPMDRLRHWFVAMCLHCQRMPELAAGESMMM